MLRPIVVDARVDVRLVDVHQADVEALERADMGDAAAHLAGADDADALDLHDGLLQRYFLSTAAVSSGTIWNRSPTRP